MSALDALKIELVSRGYRLEVQPDGTEILYRPDGSVAVRAKPRPAPVSSQEKYLSTLQTAARLGVKQKTVRKWIYAGILKAKRFPDGSFHISESVVEKFGSDVTV